MSFPFALLDWNVQSQEILIRFLFARHLKKSNLEITLENLKDQEIFLDNRGVSLMRSRYASISQCKEYAELNPNRLIGFVLFKKTTFDAKVEQNKTDRSKFVAVIEASPLDENSNYVVPKGIDWFINSRGNPFHADIVYVNPGVEEGNLTPNQAIRIFSRMLLKSSKLIFLKDVPKFENSDVDVLFDSEAQSAAFQ